MAKKAYIGVNGVARKIKKGYVGVENFTKRSLPSGYTQVEYIESSGTQYVDTGFKPNQDTRVVMDVQIPDNSPTFCLFGTRYSVSSQRYEFVNTSTNFHSAYNTSAGTGGASTTGRIQIDKNKNVTTLDGEPFGTLTYSAFQCATSMMLFATKINGDVGLPGAALLYSCQIYDNGTLVRDFIPCTNTSGVAGLYDVVNAVFYTDAAGGTFTAGATYKGVARKIRKAYIGVGGVARPCWGNGEPAYYGAITSLQAARYQLAGAGNGDYAVFYSGYASTSSPTAYGDAYNKFVTRSNLSNISPAIAEYAGVSLEQEGIALFGYGYELGAIVNYITVYNKSLTKTQTTTGTSRYSVAGAAVGKYAIFAGGRTLQTASFLTSVNAVNSSLTAQSISALSTQRYYATGASVGNYALISGGQTTTSDKTAVVEAYDSSLTKISSVASMSNTRIYHAGASSGTHAFFAGGTGGETHSSVDAYDSSLTKYSAPNLASSIEKFAGTGVSGYAIFSGGSYEASAYDENLTKTSLSALSESRSNLAAATVGDYAIFAGGGQGIYPKSTVDAYVVV